MIAGMALLDVGELYPAALDLAEVCSCTPCSVSRYFGQPSIDHRESGFWYYGPSGVQALDPMVSLRSSCASSHARDHGRIASFTVGRHRVVHRIPQAHRGVWSYVCLLPPHTAASYRLAASSAAPQPLTTVGAPLCSGRLLEVEVGTSLQGQYLVSILHARLLFVFSPPAGNGCKWLEMPGNCIASDRTEQ